jgi:hypothetical protein
MSNPIWNFLSGALKPVTDLIDNLHTSDAERAQLKNELFASQAAFANKLLDYESRLIDAQAKVITAEARGASWIQRSWRPITMLTFLVLVVCDSFGLLAFRLAEQAWTLLQIGLGGYVVGRSAEKIAPAIAGAISTRKDH